MTLFHETSVREVVSCQKGRVYEVNEQGRHRKVEFTSVKPDFVEFPSWGRVSGRGLFFYSLYGTIPRLVFCNTRNWLCFRKLLYEQINYIKKCKTHELHSLLFSKVD